MDGCEDGSLALGFEGGDAACHRHRRHPLGSGTMSDLAACHDTMLAADRCHGGRRIERHLSPSPKWPNPIVRLLSVATNSPSFVEERRCPDLVVARAHAVIGEEARSCRCDGFFIRQSAAVNEIAMEALPPSATVRRWGCRPVGFWGKKMMEHRNSMLRWCTRPCVPAVEFL
ncbi:hypothetical protein ACLOJK_024218 [Asimina triloba]